MSVIEIKEKTVSEKIKKQGRVIVDCYASWCGPCRMLSPIIDELASEMTDYTFYKLNVDESIEFASEYEIMSIPTILIFENGNLVNRITGFKPKEELKEIFSK